MDNSRCDYDLLQAVARKLKQLREAKGLSQRIVYIDTDFNIGKIEVGKTNITISTLSRLCNYYGTSLKEFFDELDQ
ncbi:helix-turn-helix domain-containing protein [Alistipes timonensis]